MYRICLGRQYTHNMQYFHFSCLFSWFNITAGIARVPEGYEKMGHREAGYSLAEQHSSGPESGHRTVMFTAEGSVYSKK